MNKVPKLDLHVHSNLSFDTYVSMEDYINSNKVIAENKVFLTTEHMEATNIGIEHLTDFDYKTYIEKYDEIEDIQDNIRFIKGVEVGYNIKCNKMINYFLDAGDFDFKLLSFHTSTDMHYMHLKEGQVFDVEDYLDVIINGLKDIKVDQFQVITHLDFPFRLEHNIDDMNHFLNSDKLKEIFSLIIEKHLALEVNTSSLYKYGNLEFYQKLLPLYRDCGGIFISLGSDCHDNSNYRYKFTEATELINEVSSDFKIINDTFLTLWQY